MYLHQRNIRIEVCVYYTLILSVIEIAYMDILRLKNGEGSASPEIVLNLLQSSAFSFRDTFSSEYYIHYRDDTEEQERCKKSIGFLYEKMCYQVCL